MIPITFIDGYSKPRQRRGFSIYRRRCRRCNNIFDTHMKHSKYCENCRLPGFGQSKSQYIAIIKTTTITTNTNITHNNQSKNEKKSKKI